MHVKKAERHVSGSTVLNASAQEIFDVLADFRRHREIDGSGTVRGGLTGPARLSLGARFGMRMRFGIPYVIRNEVVEFVEPTRIAWRHFGHHVWRYELEPIGAETTRVVETFDWRPSRLPWVLERVGYPARNKAAIDATMRRLEDRFGTA